MWNNIKQVKCFIRHNVSKYLLIRDCVRIQLRLIGIIIIYRIMKHAINRCGNIITLIKFSLYFKCLNILLPLYGYDYGNLKTLKVRMLLQNACCLCTYLLRCCPSNISVKTLYWSVKYIIHQAAMCHCHFQCVGLPHDRESSPNV